MASKVEVTLATGSGVVYGEVSGGKRLNLVPGKPHEFDIGQTGVVIQMLTVSRMDPGKGSVRIKAASGKGVTVEFDGGSARKLSVGASTSFPSSAKRAVVREQF